MNTETTTTISARLETTLVEQIDELAEALSARVRGIRVTRTDAIRIVLERGVEALQAEMKRPAKK